MATHPSRSSGSPSAGNVSELARPKKPHGVTRENWLWRLEVGPRAAMHSDTLQRDMRWWRGVWGRTKWRR